MRDSHGLFDYENSQVKIISLTINSESILIRNQKKHEVQTIIGDKFLSEDPEEYRQIANISISNGKKTLNQTNISFQRI